MIKRGLTERDICTKFIPAGRQRAGWDEMMTQVREDVYYTKGRIIVRGQPVTRKANRRHLVLRAPRAGRPEGLFNDQADPAGDFSRLYRLVGRQGPRGDAAGMACHRRRGKGARANNLDIKNPHAVAYDHGDLETLLADLARAEAETAGLRDQLKVILADLSSMRDGPMNADRLKRYERIADAPGAIARLRRFLSQPRRARQARAAGRGRRAVACVEENQRGQAHPAINDADFAVLPFPLPPLAEQYRIVAKVDALIALCDRLEASLTAAAAATCWTLCSPRELAPAEDRDTFDSASPDAKPVPTIADDASEAAE